VWGVKVRIRKTFSSNVTTVIPASVLETDETVIFSDRGTVS
jgi:hypothetical protein